MCVECFSHIHLNFCETAHTPPCVFPGAHKMTWTHKKSCTSSSPPKCVHPALHTTATWKLWPSCVLANPALAPGSLGKEQPSFCQSAVFPCRERWSYFSFEFPLNRSYCPYVWFVRQLGRLGFSPHTSPIFRLDCWLWYTRLICSCR